MRIIGGQWRGLRLASIRGQATRPTADRVREALFNLVRDDIVGAAVADCCCGSGALGLEALSRGAAYVDFVDLAPSALSTVRTNLTRCGADTATWRLHRADAARWLARRLEQEPRSPLVVLADPPYGGPVPAALLTVLTAAAYRPTLVVLEHPTSENPEFGRDQGWCVDTRHYGRTALSLFRPAMNKTEADDA